MRIAVVIALLLSPFATAQACDCVDYAVKALRSVHVRIQTMPDITADRSMKHLGEYSRSVVSVRDIDDCDTMVHELVHHVQWERAGDAQDQNEWHRREMEANMVTARAMSEMGACQ